MRYYTFLGLLVNWCFMCLTCNSAVKGNQSDVISSNLQTKIPCNSPNFQLSDALRTL